MVFRQETNLYDDNAIARKFSSQDTKFEVVQGKISYLISDSEIEEYGSGKGTVTSRLNTAESNIDGNSSLISSLTTQYDTLSGEVTAYESSTNEYKQTTNQTISTITQTVQTKTRTFNTQPTPPYSVNDLWLKDRDLYVCTVAKTSGQQFAETDWTLATKYTSDAALTQFIENTYASDKTTLQSQIDGKIETWNQSDDPSTAWATTAEKGKHTGDLWYRTSDNTTWRYTGSAWVKQDVPTSVIGAINGKAVLWTTQPTPPYTTNDLWVQGSSGDIMKCVNARASGSYVSSDWAKASKYTDDSALNTWLSGTYASDKSSLQTQIDGKIETWSQTSDPSTAWTTTALKNQHKGDLWYNTTSSVQKYFRWSGTAWVEITATPPNAITTSINGKANIFTGSSTPSGAKSGDLWFKSATDPILTYVNGAWTEYNKYTDDSAFNTWKGNTSYTTFKSFIDQLPNQINLTVEASGKYAAKASIIAEINESTESSSVKIKADRLTLEGDTLINAVNNGTGTVSINADRVNLSAYSTKTYAESLVTQTASEINSTVKGIENSKSSNYKGTEAPTDSNYPASDWISIEQKVQHIGDIYYDSTTGYSYQYQVSGRGIQIKFNDQCQTENTKYDYVVIYYQIENQLYSSARFGGTSIAGKTFFIPSRIFWVYWHTDSSNSNYYGFSIDSATVYSSMPIDGVPVPSLPDYTEVAVSDISQIKSAHNPYDNNANVLWKYTHSSGISPNFTGAWIRRKDGELTATQSGLATVQSDLATAQSTISQLSDQITLKVSKGDIASTINQTAQSVLISASKINLSGYATFTSLSTAGSTSINGSNIYGGTLTLGGNGNANGKLIIKDSSNTQIGYWNNTGINITKGSINIGNGKFAVNTSGDFSVNSNYLTIADDEILAKSSNSDTPTYSAKFSKGDLRWYFKNFEVAKISVFGHYETSQSVETGWLMINADTINITANDTLLYVGKHSVLVELSDSDDNVRFYRASKYSSSPQRFGTFEVYTNDVIINGNSGISGTYRLGNYNVTFTKGIATNIVQMS